MSISPKLKARIDALPYESLRVEVLNHLHSPRRKRMAERARMTGSEYRSDEETFELMVKNYTAAMTQRALREAIAYRWREDEVMAFLEHFKKKMPPRYAEYLGQVCNGRQIDRDLASDMERLAEHWHPGLDVADYEDLFIKARHYAQAHLI